MSFNSWIYVYGNPITYTDPTGHDYQYGEIFPDKRDLTDWLPRAAAYMATDAEILEIKRLKLSNQAHENLMALYKFYNIVRDGARFDVKDKILLNLGHDIKLSENWYEYSVTGNILYGFYGSAAGYRPQTLHKGAGYAQMTDVLRWLLAVGVLCEDNAGPFPDFGGPVHNFDTPDDYHAVDFGIWLYERYFVAKGTFTKTDFLQGLSTYEFVWGLPGVPDPGNYKPNTSGPYAPDEFNH
jgi:hypothetical protein